MDEQAQQAYREEIRRMRARVQAFVEAQAAEGAQTWPLAAALCEKALEILVVHHSKDEAHRLLDGLRDVLDRDGKNDDANAG